MKNKSPLSLISLSVFVVMFSTQLLQVRMAFADELYIKSEIQSILSVLSDNLNRFESLQKTLEKTGKNDKNYDEHKNIWLSTTLAIYAISSVCEYQNDLLALFMDLKEKRRVHYFDVRIRSLETSVEQISIMYEQIKINNRLMPPDVAERNFYEQLEKNINSSIDLLEKSKNLILQLKKG